MTSKPSSPVQCFKGDFVPCKTSGILRASVASVLPSACMTFEILGPCLVSGIPSRVWLPVQQKFSDGVVGWDIVGVWVSFMEY